MPKREPIGTLFVSITRRLRARIQQEIVAAGFEDFTVAHQAVFAVLPEEGARIGELARSAQLAKQTMTGMVADLVERGYLQRMADPTDGRAALVRRTSRGNRVHQVAQQALEEVEADWTSILGPRNFEHLVRLLCHVQAL